MPKSGYLLKIKCLVLNQTFQNKTKGLRLKNKQTRFEAFLKREAKEQ